MANTRGNTYSRGNKYYRDTDLGYWAHSMDELALIDLPAQIDYILQKTSQKSLAVVGHSQGCTLPLMLLSAKPEYNEKVWLLMLLGAVTHAELIKAPYLSSAARTGSPAVRGWGVGRRVRDFRAWPAAAASGIPCGAAAAAGRHC